LGWTELQWSSTSLYLNKATVVPLELLDRGQHGMDKRSVELEYDEFISK